MPAARDAAITTCDTYKTERYTKMKSALTARLTAFSQRRYQVPDCFLNARLWKTATTSAGGAPRELAR
jgi:hypothetical protein